ncbi:hypothetical protein FLL45_22110 [Aliikangiella marina]|uniref:Uncharacterized protein n=1 Tax=Aliikangiella marina TaxID=1712262 RepID=A0A545T1D0_9GAMM|nr:hypothetical protein [Aliikangiella marina]TQV71024.1 hypothetical protein FLL45_22110 [Aliikangiella marina]
MSPNNSPNPHTEQDYLLSSAVLSLSIGFILTLNFWSWLLADVSTNSTITTIVQFAVFALFIVTLVYLSRTSRGAFTFNRRAFWLGQFSDEFLNHINRKGYQYAFNVTCFVLILLMLSDFGGFAEAMAGVSASTLAKSILGVMFISYALPVLFLLRAEDE